MSYDSPARNLFRSRGARRPRLPAALVRCVAAARCSATLPPLLQQPFPQALHAARPETQKASKTPSLSVHRQRYIRYRKTTAPAQTCSPRPQHEFAGLVVGGSGGRPAAEAAGATPPYVHCYEPTAVKRNGGPAPHPMPSSLQAALSLTHTRTHTHIHEAKRDSQGVNRAAAPPLAHTKGQRRQGSCPPGACSSSHGQLRPWDHKLLHALSHRAPGVPGLARGTRRPSPSSPATALPTDYAASVHSGQPSRPGARRAAWLLGAQHNSCRAPALQPRPGACPSCKN
jgi:hypothetical protein